MQKSEALFRVQRSDQILFEGSCTSLKRHKLDVDRVGKGTECGILLNPFDQTAEVIALHLLPSSRSLALPIGRCDSGDFQEEKEAED